VAAVLLVLAALLWTPTGQAHVKAVRLLAQEVPQVPVKPLGALTRTPRHERIALASVHGPIVADLFRPVPRFGTIQPHTEPTVMLALGVKTKARDRKLILSSLTVLPNGRVLVLGWSLTTMPSVPQAALYAPRTNRWTSIGRVPFAGTATLLATGNVLVVGSAKTVGPPVPSAVLYHPRTGSWTPTGHPHIPLGSVVRLANSKVLVTGGFGPAGPLSFFTSQSPILTDAEVYDPRTGQWTATGHMLTGRQAPAEALLPDGKVLFAGGANGANLSSAEVDNPAWAPGAPPGAWRPSASVPPRRCFLMGGSS
jgi:hypothetical protein